MCTLYQRKAGIEEREMDGELMLLDETVDRIHVLNGSATSIWNCLDDPISASAIEQRLGDEYDMGSVTDAPAVIDRTLKQLTDAGVVTEIAPDGRDISP